MQASLTLAVSITSGFQHPLLALVATQGGDKFDHPRLRLLSIKLSMAKPSEWWGSRWTLHKSCASSSMVPAVAFPWCITRHQQCQMPFSPDKNQPSWYSLQIIAFTGHFIFTIISSGSHLMCAVTLSSTGQLELVAIYVHYFKKILPFRIWKQEMFRYSWSGRQCLKTINSKYMNETSSAPGNISVLSLSDYSNLLSSLVNCTLFKRIRLPFVFLHSCMHACIHPSLLSTDCVFYKFQAIGA